MKSAFKTVLVTGTPGTGKTVLARKLSLLLDYTYFNVNLFAKKSHLSRSYDRKRRSYVIDEGKLASSLIKVRQKALKSGQEGIIFDSHMSHFFPSKYADLCIVARCGLKALRQRLQDRGYPAAKVRENLDAEIFEICLSEAREAGHRVLVFDTARARNSDVKALAAKVRKAVRT